MKLYHGTNADVETIDPARGQKYKDFGKGFQDKYLDQQYFFGTTRALNFLHKLNVEEI